MDDTTMIARFLFDQVGTAVTSFANESSASLIAFIGPLAVTLLTIYVLDAFQKKTQATSKRDIRLAKQRFALLSRE